MLARSIQSGLWATLIAAIASLSAPPATAAECTAGEVAISGHCVASEQLAQDIRSIVQGISSEFDLSATIVAVEVEGVPVLTEAFGHSMAGVPARTDMHFRSGSVAIAYMGVVLLKLQEAGLLSLDDRLAQWFPNYPQAEEVTLGMLINSTSGYADYVNLEILPLYENVFRQFEPEELIQVGLEQPMVCAPGTCFSYAHANLVILGQMLEQASGRTVDALIEDYVLAPLSLANSQTSSTPAIQEPVLHAYTSERGLFEDSTFWSPSWTLAKGAILTSDIADLLTSAEALGSGSLLSPASQDLFLAPWTAEFPPFNEISYYGLGIVVSNGWVVQNPSFHGYWAAIASLPARDINIAVAMTSGPETPERSPETAPPNTALLIAIATLLAPDQAPIQKH